MSKLEIELDKSTVNIMEAQIEEAKYDELPKIKSLSEMSMSELKGICDKKGLTYKKVGESKNQLIEKIEGSNILGNISLDNKKISPEIIEKADEPIPVGFINVPVPKKTAEDEMLCYKGRFYKKLANGYGMWTDNGITFDLDEIR